MPLANRPHTPSTGPGSGSGPDSVYWLIIRDPADRKSRSPEIFTSELEEGRLLPVFSSGESAGWFLDHVPDPKDGGVDYRGDNEETVTGALAQSGWRARAVRAGELVSLLSGSAYTTGPGAGVRSVIVDPSIEVFDRARRSGKPIGDSYKSLLRRLVDQKRDQTQVRDGAAETLPP